MEDSAKFFLKKDIAEGIRIIQKSFFDIVEDLRATDADNFEHLKSLLGNDDLALKFKLFHENRYKLVRKRILDATGDMKRLFDSNVEDYDVEFIQDIEVQGIIKTKDKV